MVVKTFCVDPEDNCMPWKEETLPYELVESSKAVDIWSLGCVVFELVTCQPFEKVTTDNDLTSYKSMERIMNWDEDIASEKRAAIQKSMSSPVITTKRHLVLGDNV